MRLRRYQAANREGENARQARYRARNPDRVAERSREYYARLRSATVETVHRLVVLELLDGVCGLCGEDVDPFFFHVDHIVPISLGGEHSYENTQPAHPSCNTRKGRRTS